MAASQGVQEYIQLSDFTPGIVSARHAAGGAQPAPQDAEQGAIFAQEDGTWGCTGHATGGLHPLPGIVETVADPGNDWPSASLIPHWDANTLYGPIPSGLAESAGEPILVVNATAVITPVRTVPANAYDAMTEWREHEGATPDQLAVLYGVWDEAPIHQTPQAGVAWAQWGLRIWHMASRRTSGLLGGRDTPDATHWLGERVIYSHRDHRNVLTLFGLRGERLEEALGDHRMALGMGAASMFPVTTMTNLTYPAIRPGQIGSMGLGIVSGRIGTYPRISSAAAALGADAVWSQNARYLDNYNAGVWNRAYTGVSHQNRMVFQQGGSQYHGDRTVALSADVTGWTAAADLLAGRDSRNYRFMAENPGSYGAMASMNANELFLVKQTGGGCVVRGDVGSPQVITLPGLPSTNGASNIPVVTTDGVVYGTREGVYVWNGEETAELISPQLEGCFWLPDGTPSIEDAILATLDYPPRGKFNVLGEMLYAPNNWVRSSVTQGWFRLAPTWLESNDEHAGTTYRNFEVSASGKMYAIKPYVVPTDLTVAHLYDPATPTSVFSWRSQPIGRAINRQLEIRELVATVQGHGTVEVTLYGDTEQQTVEIPVDSDRPVVIRQEVKVNCNEVEVGLVSRTSAEIPLTPDGAPMAVRGNPAPSVYSLNLGYRPVASAPKSAGVTTDPIPTPPVEPEPAPDQTVTLTRNFTGTQGYVQNGSRFEVLRDIWTDFEDQLPDGHHIKSISAIRIRSNCRVDGTPSWSRVLNIAPLLETLDAIEGIGGISVPAERQIAGTWSVAPSIAASQKSTIPGVSATKANGLVIGAAPSVYTTAGVAYFLLPAPTSPLPATFGTVSGTIEATFIPSTPTILAAESPYDVMLRFANGGPGISGTAQYNISRIQIDCVTGA